MLGGSGFANSGKPVSEFASQCGRKLWEAWQSGEMRAYPTMSFSSGE